MTQRIGLKDIAGTLELDVSTVSRALRRDPRVHPETAQAVHATASALGYRPNAAARALRGGPTGRVAVLLSPPQHRFASPIFLELLSTLERHLRDSGRTLTVFAAQSRDEEPGIIRDIVQGRLADGLVLGRTRQNDERVRFLIENGFPFVTFGRTAFDGEHPSIEIDYAEAGRIAVEALLAARPDELHILSAPEGQRFADNYVSGALLAATGASPPVVIHRIELTEELGQVTASAIFAAARPAKRIALACIQDLMAFGAYRAAALAGRAVGRDTSVFGGQDFPGSEHAAPPLSTFSTEDARVAGLLTQAMLARLDTPDAAFMSETIKPTAVLRGSHLLAR
ncbi:MAG: LacI family transcriptional regulator [Rhizobiaceae bacterium]|nr:LacI family transcriptional regulator [Rhizobiaceae bacterium]